MHFRVFVMIPKLSANDVDQLTLPLQKSISPNKEKCSTCPLKLFAGEAEWRLWRARS